MLLLLTLGCAPPPPSPPPPLPAALRVWWPTAAEVPANALHLELVWDEAMELTPLAVEAGGPGSWGPAAARVQWSGDLQVTHVELDLPVGATALRLSGATTASGLALPPLERPLVVLPSDHTPPRGATVTGAPVAGSLAPLTVRFPEPMHHRSLGSLTALGGGAIQPGTWSLSPDQRTATFAPAVPWPDTVRVSLGAGLCDLAGNRLEERPTGLLIPESP